MADNHRSAEGRETQVTVATGAAWARLAKDGGTALSGLSGQGVDRLEERAKKKLILFVEIDNRATDGVVVMTQSRSDELAGRSPVQGKMAAVFLNPETGRAAPLVVTEKREGKVEGRRPRQNGVASSLDLSLTFPDELQAEETVVPFPSLRGQALRPPVMRCRERDERSLPSNGTQYDGSSAGGFCGETFSSGDLFVDFDKYDVTVGGRKVYFPHMTTELLFFLIRHPGKFYSRERLLDQVWGCNVYVSPRNVDVHISRIRRAIEKDPARPTYITSLRGVGYKFDGAGR